MLKKVIKYARSIRQDLLRSSLFQRNILAMSQLSDLFTEEKFIPFTRWSMSPFTITHCLNVIEIFEKKSIIEFGSGAATIHIAKLLKLNDRHCDFVSIESDKAWCDSIRATLTRLELENYVKLIHAPETAIDKKFTHEDQKTWYDTKVLDKELEKIEYFDFVIVDGPFGGSTPYARYSAYPFLKAKSDENTHWLLDDTGRAHEDYIIDNWNNSFKGIKRDYHRYSMLQKNDDFDATPFH